VKKPDKISGTKEWSVASLNIHLGCSHQCRYCYAREKTVRYERCTIEQWGTEYNRFKDRPFIGFNKKYDGVVMFPTTHDLQPELLPEVLKGIGLLLAADNTILLVTKPHFEVVKAICKEFPGEERIRWRFTIGAMDDIILSYWEPGAPIFAERFASLKYACQKGFSTSVSVEPMLDSDHIIKQFRRLESHITDTFWIGKMNNIRKKNGELWRVQPDTDPVEIARIEAGQTDTRIHEIYEALKDEPKIRWKESFKSVLGLELAQEPGQDV
jgi:DNA repair photolyase